MKSNEEIEKIAQDSIFTEEGQVGFVVGYNRCLKDNSENKYTEEDLIKIIHICKPFIFDKDLRDSIFNKTIEEFKSKRNI